MAQAAPLVLYVEDDFDLSVLVSEILEAHGFSTATARDGKQALTLLDQGLAPKVVVTDLMMPRMDGFGFLARYRELPGPHAPVLAVSAFDSYLRRAAETGAAATLRKPFGAEALVAAVRDLAGGRTPAGVPDEPFADDEGTRLDAVLALKLDQPAPTDALQDFAERVARIFEVPVCLVSIVTKDRQYWHSFCGLPDDLAQARGTPREDSFCTHAVSARAALVVQDASENPFFRDNVLVRERGLRFYAGVPIFSRTEAALGTLCLLDFAPRGFGYFDLELLGLLARRVAAEIEWRERREHPGEALSSFRSLEFLDEETGTHGRAAFHDILLMESLRTAERNLSLAVGVAAVPREKLRSIAAAVKEALPRAHVGRIGPARLGVAAIGAREEGLRSALAGACGPGAKVLAVSFVGPGSGRVALARLEAALDRG